MRQSDSENREQSKDESPVEETTDDGDVLTADVDDTNKARPRAAVVAFQAAVSEARKEAETRLTAVVEKIRKTAVDEYANEIVDRHAKELQQLRKTVSAEVTECVRQEEAQRHAADVTRMREELERRNADDLRGTQTAVVDSFNRLTRNILQSL